MSGAVPGERRAVIIEDDAEIAELLAVVLGEAGFRTEIAGDGLRGLQLISEHEPLLTTLDVNLPGIDGYEVVRRIRGFSATYVIMLSARSEEIDTLTGLNSGADDYLTKPFSPRELMARVRARLRRPRLATVPTTGEGTSPVLAFGDLSVDGEAREARLDGTLVELTRTEFDLLHVLALRPGYAFSRRQLIDEVWGENWHSDDHLVDAHIVHLRRKLGDDAATGRYVRTVRGVGYRMGDGA